MADPPRGVILLGEEVVIVRWDFSLRHRAEDRWADARVAADEQRRLRQLAAAQKDSRESKGTSRELADAGFSGRFRRWLEGIAGFISLLLIILVAQVGAQTVTDMARNLAENVLGSGSVVAVRLADEGQTLHLRWESATYRPKLPIPEARDQMYSEAVLATGSVLGRLTGVLQIRFTMVHGSRALASGENRRGHGLSITFTPELGGGKMTPPPAQPSPGGSVQQQMSGGTSAKSW